MIAVALIVSEILYVIGVFGVLTRRNAIILFMCVELILNAVSLSFVALARMHGVSGQVFVVMVMTVASAEAAVGLAMVISVFRQFGTAELSALRLLRDTP